MTMMPGKRSVLLGAILLSAGGCGEPQTYRPSPDAAAAVDGGTGPAPCATPVMDRLRCEDFQGERDRSPLDFSGCTSGKWERTGFSATKAGEEALKCTVKARLEWGEISRYQTAAIRVSQTYSFVVGGNDEGLLLTVRAKNGNQPERDRIVRTFPPGAQNDVTSELGFDLGQSGQPILIELQLSFETVDMMMQNPSWRLGRFEVFGRGAR